MNTRAGVPSKVVAGRKKTVAAQKSMGLDIKKYKMNLLSKSLRMGLRSDLRRDLNPIIKRLESLEQVVSSNNGSTASKTTETNVNSTIDSLVNEASSCNNVTEMSNTDVIDGTLNAGIIINAANRNDASGLGKGITYTVLNSVKERPSFAGKLNDNPVKFLKDIEKYYRAIGMRGNKLSIAVDCLTGAAESWASLYEEQWTSFEDFSNGFLQCYWSDDIQTSVLSKLLTGKWQKDEGISMMDYFIKCYQQAKSLAVVMSECQITDRIFRHFPREIQNLWMGRNIKTVKNATELLNSWEHREVLDSENYDTVTRAHNQRESSNSGNRVAPYKRREVNRERQVGVNVLSKRSRTEKDSSVPVVVQTSSEIQVQEN